MLLVQQVPVVHPDRPDHVVKQGSQDLLDPVDAPDPGDHQDPVDPQEKVDPQELVDNQVE